MPQSKAQKRRNKYLKERKRHYPVFVCQLFKFYSSIRIISIRSASALNSGIYRLLNPKDTHFHENL